MIAFMLLGQSTHLSQEAISRFGKVNGTSPRRIIFFRDGLSEGEYTGVGELEFQDIKGWKYIIYFRTVFINYPEAIRRVWAEVKLKDPWPLITYIIVGKRYVIATPLSSRTI
jgi:eukaryotic translation initiation factor 2C